MTIPVEPLAVLQRAAIRPSEVARRIGVERTTVYRWMKSGALPFFELGGSKYVLVAAYERFVERHRGGATLEQQAARYIGPGVEVEGDVERYAGLPLAAVAVHALSETVGPASPVADARQLLRGRLDAYEARFGLPSERVHREILVEHGTGVPGIPPDEADAWARTYAAYASLSLIQTR